MADFDVRTVESYEEFAETWAGEDVDSRLLWQLLGQLDADEVLVGLPEWLAEEKAGYVEGAPPTVVVGRIQRETEKAVLLADSAAVRPLVKRAHRIHELERVVADKDRDPDREEWLADRLAEHRRAFERRDDVPSLADEWFPKSQLRTVVRRRS